MDSNSQRDFDNLVREAKRYASDGLVGHTISKLQRAATFAQTIGIEFSSEEAQPIIAAAYEARTARYRRLVEPVLRRTHEYISQGFIEESAYWLNIARQLVGEYGFGENLAQLEHYAQEALVEPSVQRARHYIRQGNRHLAAQKVREANEFARELGLNVQYAA